MITFSYKLSSYRAFVEAFAAFIGAEFTNQQLQIPPQLGSGFMKVVDFDGIEAIVYNLTLTDDLLLKREKSPAEFYTLNFDEVEDLNGIRLRIGDEAFSANQQRKAFLYLTGFLYSMDNLLQKGINLRGIRIFLPLPWLRKYLRVDENEAVIERYIKLKTAGVISKTIDAESRELVNELLHDGNLSLLAYQNKTLRLVEKFFDWLYNEMQVLPHLRSISRQDIAIAQQIEAVLTSDTTVLPPTIKELSRQFALSESKLKKVFKTVFGLPPYEYFQKFRMQKARYLLLSGKYPIKDIGYTLGYSNLSNFTLAFKKEFGQLPSQVLKEAKA